MYESGMDIVVVNWRTPHDLLKFLHSYNEYMPTVEHDLWIYNVEPTKEDLSAAERAVTRLGAHHLVAKENIGYAKACNHAARIGEREIIAFFNADVILTEGALDECYVALRSRKENGILGPRQIGERNLITHAGIFGTNDNPALRGWKHPNSDEYADVRDDAVSVSGSAYFVKRSLWDLLSNCELYRAAAPQAEGAFLPTPHYYEETFCSYHARAHGFRVIYYGPVCIKHLWHQSSPIGGKTEREYMPLSREIFRSACDLHGIEHD